MSDATERRRRRFRRTAKPNSPATSESHDGRMTLVEHLRELRSRMAIAAGAILLASVVGWIFYPQIVNFLLKPFLDASKELSANGEPAILSLTGVADAFNLKIQVAFSAGVLIASPIWLYQLFRFITPGLHRNERRWAATFVAGALPLFLAGVVVAYAILPRLLGAFLGLAPDGVTNIIAVDQYVGFLLQLVVVFGLGCIAPVVIVVLNSAGILSAQRFASWWRWVIVFTLIFAAVATPTGDPVNMLLFAAPLLVLMFIAFAISWNTDRRRAKRAKAAGLDVDDDEISPLDLTPSSLDDDIT